MNSQKGKSIFINNLEEHMEMINKLSILDNIINKAVDSCANAICAGRKILLCGNGGSASDSQHIAAEFTGRFKVDRRPLPALALSTDTSAITCISNDYHFRDVFSRQVQALGSQGDCLIGISTSGNSENVIQAFKEARSKGITTIGLLGRSGGVLASHSDLAIVVPCDITARIQEAHILIGHTICESVELELISRGFLI